MINALSTRKSNDAIGNMTAIKSSTPHHRRQVSDDSSGSCRRQPKKLRSMAVLASPFKAVKNAVSKKTMPQHVEAAVEDPDAIFLQELAVMEATPVDKAVRIPSGLEQMLQEQIAKEAALEGSDEGIGALRASYIVAINEYFQTGFTEGMVTLCKDIDSFDDDASSPSHHLDRVMDCASEQTLDLFIAGQFLMQQMEGSKAFETLKGLLVLAQTSVEFLMEPHMSYSMPTELELDDDDDAKARVDDATRILRWIHRYLDRVNEYGNGVLLRSSLWSRRIEVLVEVYMQYGVVRNVTTMLERSMKLRIEEDVYEMRDGRCVTGYTEDVAWIINNQLNVAKENLPDQYTGKVLAACNEALRVAVEQSTMEVGTKWREMSVDRLCSIVNDATHISDQCEERNKVYLENDNREAGEVLCGELMELALFATQQLCQRVILDLQDENILTSIGDEAVWADPDGPSAVECTHRTFSDYFDDLESWLPAYFFTKVLKHCFDLSMERYIEAFLGNSMSGRVRDAGVTAAAMRCDYDAFVAFWCEGIPLQYHGKAGFYSKRTIHQRLSLILSFQRIVLPNNQAEDVQEEIDTVLVELGIETGIPTILHLVGLRGKQEATVSLRWHEVLSKVKSVVSLEDDGEEQKASHRYSLPDLRNSRFLTNVQPPQGRQLEKMCRNHSETESMDISDTSELVKSRRIQRVRQKVGQTARTVGTKIKAGQKIRGVRRFVARKIRPEQARYVACD